MLYVAVESAIYVWIPTLLSANGATPTVIASARAANAMGMDPRVARARYPQQCKSLVDARTSWFETKRQQARRSVEQAYLAAATELTQLGKPVHSKSLQQQSGLVAFGHNAPRVEVLRSVLAQVVQAAR